MRNLRRGIIDDALDRIVRPLPIREQRGIEKFPDGSERLQKAVNRRGFLRVWALDRVIAWAFDVSLRFGFHERRMLRYVEPLRDCDTTTDDGVDMACLFAHEWRPIRLAERRAYYTHIVDPETGEPEYLPSWSGSTVTPRKWAIRRSLGRDAVPIAREKLREAAGFDAIYDGEAAADAIECLGLDSMGALAIDAIVRAGVLEDIRRDVENASQLGFKFGDP